jgi:hypothetical protein
LSAGSNRFCPPVCRWPARQRAKRIEAASDRRDETPFAAAIGGDGTEHRRRRLMRAIGPAKALNGAVSAPARLEKKMHSALLVLGIKAGVVGAPRAAGIGEDEDALGPAHEGIGIGQRLVGGTRFKPLAAIGQGHGACGR